MYQQKQEQLARQELLEYQMQREQEEHERQMEILQVEKRIDSISNLIQLAESQKSEIESELELLDPLQGIASLFGGDNGASELHEELGSLEAKLSSLYSEYNDAVTLRNSL